MKEDPALICPKSELEQMKEVTQICSKPESQERKKDVPQLQNSMPSQFCFLQVSAQQVRQSNPGLAVFKFPVLECR